MTQESNHQTRTRTWTLLLIAILLSVTLAVEQTRAATPSPTGAVDQPIGTWTKVDNPGWSGDSHSWISATDGWSFSPQPPWGIEFYRWDGTEWKVAQTLDKNGLKYLLGTDIQMLSATDGWAVAMSPNDHYSTFFRWNGSNWESFQTITDTDIASLDMINPSEGWAVGYATCCGSNYYQWNGSAWQKEDYTELHWTTSDISMISATDGWSVGNGIARRNGDSWAKFDSSISGRFSGIDMLASNDGWIVGENGAILRWAGGSDWTAVASPTSNNLRDIEMVSSNDGWAVGEKGTILHWDGTQWSLVPSPTTTDLREIDMTSATDGWIPYYDRAASSPGLLHYTVIQPSLIINYNSGSPGSFFSVAGTGFPAESKATVKTNGTEIGSVATDASGALGFVLDTAQADVGAYYVTVEVNPSATVSFILDAEAPLRPQEGSETIIELPAGLDFTNLIHLPVILRH